MPTPWEVIEFTDKSVAPGPPFLDATFLNEFQASLAETIDDVIAHVGAGGAAHANAVAAGGAGFMTGADKTKLDGIEAGARVSMTASEILTALKTVDGAGSLLDADLLDGLEASAFAPIGHVGAGGAAHANAVAAGAAGFMTGTDKTKLDGVEAGATADQTAAEILAALFTVDGAGSLLDADLLDGTQLADIQLRSEKNAASGYLGLNASSIALAQYLGTGTRDGTKFLRDDNTWQTAGAGASATLSGYIRGLQIQRDSANALTVKTGGAWIQSLGAVLDVSTAISKTGLVLTANTWYAIYLYSNAGTPDIEISTTTPAAPYSGRARSKTGDTSRRFLGYWRASAANTLRVQSHDGEYVRFLDTVTVAPYRVVESFSGTTATNTSLAALVPPTSTRAVAKIRTASTAGWIMLAPGGSAEIFEFPNGNGGEIALELSSAQDLRHMNNAAGGGTSVEIIGYYEQR